MSNTNEMAIHEQARAPGAFSSIAAFEDAQRMAKALCASPLVPKDYQDNLGSAVIALELSQRMNMSPLMVMQNIDVIHGRPSWRSQMVIAAVNGCGRFSPLRYEMSEPSDREETIEYWVVEWRQGNKSRNKKTAVIRDRTCVAYAYDKSNGERLDGPTVSLRMAVTEGWYGKTDSKWRSIPELMLRYRAASWWGRQYAPELLMGMPTADEAHDVIDVTPDSVVVGNGGDVPSRVASVAERVRTAAGNWADVATASAASEPEPEPASNEEEKPEAAAEWPKQDERGIWLDSRGIGFMPEIHGMSAGGVPAVSKAGNFCKRRGCDRGVHAQMESDALDLLNGATTGADHDASQPSADATEAPASSSQPAQAVNGGCSSEPGVCYPDIRSAISRAATLDACDEAQDLLRDFHGPADQADELTELLIDRRRRIESLMDQA